MLTVNTNKLRRDNQLEETKLHILATSPSGQNHCLFVLEH